MTRDFSLDFEKLLKGLPRYRRMAQKLVTPNPEDDEFVRAGIVGFSFHQPTESWGKSHFRFLRSRLDLDYGPTSMEWYGEAAPAHRVFVAMCLGYLLGLHQSGVISDDEFTLAEAQLPGFMILHTARIAPPTNGDG